MQKIYPPLSTRASATQIERWRGVLRGCLGDLPKPVTATGGRGVILRALQAIVDPAIGVPQAGADIPSLPAVAMQGLPIATAVWGHLAQAVRATGPGKAAAESALRQAIGHLAPIALKPTIDDNPEPWWQQEMMILHGLHSFTLRQNDPGLLDKTLVATAYHLAEIQPDHATNEPWAVHAYASHADGNVTAETLLHAAYMNGGGVLSDTSRWILADALASLDAFALDAPDGA